MSTSAERRPRRVGEDVVVALDRPAELLSVEPKAMLERHARIEPGVDEIVNELLGRSNVQRRARIVVTLPAEQITPGILDLLFFARQPLKREVRIIKAISQMPLLVQSADVP